MRIAAISDIHSNVFALDSVLEHISNQNIDLIVCTGDIVGYLGFPNEVIERIRSERILVVQGNHDEMIANSIIFDKNIVDTMSESELTAKASKIFTLSQISEENKSYLESLPKSISIKFGSFQLLFVHGSPSSNTEYVYDDLAQLSSLAKQMCEDVLVCGHTHQPFYQIVDQKHFINVGSVGKPKTGSCEANYAIITIQEKHISCDIQTVSYDVQSMIEFIASEPLISNDLIEMIAQGK